MKRKLFLLTLVIALALASGALAQARGSARPDVAIGPPEVGTLSGGRYHLTSVTLRSTQGDAWHVSGASDGGGYHLQGQARPAASSDSGCCCTYLPCVIR
ncbi:MAG: hypothetical protein CVU38_21645 [Chloroflexi bacterium HGW-Chloroflexi-1]|nr:MAG: hypothetical protein CVU38_21645 [Chloroflexi bacterium HGW-Chloroflexi-1]